MMVRRRSPALVARRFRSAGCWPDLPAVAPALAHLSAGVPGLDGGQLGDDLLDGRAGGEHGDGLGRRWRRLLWRALAHFPDVLADRCDALGPPRPGRARAARHVETIRA